MLFVMSMEDPFFVVKDEVFKALNKTRGLYLRWRELGDTSVAETEWTTTELRNSLRSIEWDLEDLEDTITIVEKNPNKFKIDKKELTSRRYFIDATRDEVKSMKEKMSLNRTRDRDITARQPLLESTNETTETSLASSGSLATTIVNGNQSTTLTSSTSAVAAAAASATVTSINPSQNLNNLNNNINNTSGNNNIQSTIPNLINNNNNNNTNSSSGGGSGGGGVSGSLASHLAGTMASAAARHSGTKYSKLENAIDSPGHYSTHNNHQNNHHNHHQSLDSPSHRFLGESVSVQQRMLQGQDEQLDVISDSIGTLKTVSRQIGIELDEQAVMLDDFGNELETTESKLDTTMKKVAKVLHMNNDNRQWTAIIVLSILLLLVIVMFIIL